MGPGMFNDMDEALRVALGLAAVVIVLLIAGAFALGAQSLSANFIKSSVRFAKANRLGSGVRLPPPSPAIDPSSHP